jgi:hypothetical protein
MTWVCVGWVGLGWWPCWLAGWLAGGPWVIGRLVGWSAGRLVVRVPRAPCRYDTMQHDIKSLFCWCWRRRNRGERREGGRAAKEKRHDGRRKGKGSTHSLTPTSRSTTASLLASNPSIVAGHATVRVSRHASSRDTRNTAQARPCLPLGGQQDSARQDKTTRHDTTRCQYAFAFVHALGDSDGDGDGGPSSL